MLMKCIQIYKFRAECIVDVHRFLYSLAPNWVEYHVTATTFPDVTVALKTAATLDELCSVINAGDYTAFGQVYRREGGT
jgi:hypothetical protein